MDQAISGDPVYNIALFMNAVTHQFESNRDIIIILKVRMML